MHFDIKILVPKSAFSRYASLLFICAIFVAFRTFLDVEALQNYSDGEVSQADSNSTSLSSLSRNCTSLTQCYCTKGTHCGWCNPTSQSLYGDASGPENGFCGKWVYESSQCNTLMCDDFYPPGLRGTLQRAIEFGWFPSVALLLWTLANMQACREKVDKAQLENLSLESDHALSKVVALNNEGLQCEFLRPIRSYVGFRAGFDCPDAQRLPTTFDRPYSLNLSHVPNVSLRHLRVAMSSHMSFGATLQSSCSLMLLGSVNVTILRIVAQRLDIDDYARLATGINEMGAVVSALRECTAMLLSFYALGRINWWWNVQSAGFRVQGRIHDLAMLAASKQRETEAEWKALYTLYRHLMLSFFYAYKNFVPRYRKLSFKDLEDCGLQTASETRSLEKAHRGPNAVLDAWLSQWVEQHLSGEVRNQAFLSLKELRACAGGVGDWLDQRAPLSFESLLYVLVYALCLVLPFGVSQIDIKDRESLASTTHVAPVVGITLLSTFFLSLLHLLSMLQDPFGSSDEINPDALNPDYIMLSTERRLRDYLTGPRLAELEDDSYSQDV